MRVGASVRHVDGTCVRVETVMHSGTLLHAADVMAADSKCGNEEACVTSGVLRCGRQGADVGEHASSESAVESSGAVAVAVVCISRPDAQQ